MAEFVMEIAGWSGAVTSLFDSTRDYCRKYLSEKEPCFCVTVTREDLAFEQEALETEALEEGLRPRVFTDPFLERAAIQRKFARELLDKDILLLHGSTVAVDGKSYLFTARCGVGKSTHTRLYRQVFGQRAVMVNDDKPFLGITEQGVTAFGAPWSGKHGLDSNIAVPLQGICILERGGENRIRRICPEEALPVLRRQCGMPMEQLPPQKLDRLLKALTQQVGLWQMACTKAPEAAEMSHRAMGEDPRTANLPKI